MIHDSWRKLAAALVFSGVACLISSGAFAANRFSHSATADRNSQQSSTPGAKDRSQWRQLKRRMSKEEVKKLLGEPERVSVSRFFESWYYGAGSVTFDGKGKVDFWSEP